MFTEAAFTMDLSQSELERYNRQTLIDSWGAEGQKKLKGSKVAIVGVGGLGCISSMYLAAAGVGEIVLIDKDKTSLSDLNRQTLYTQKDIGHFKAETAQNRIRGLNPEVKVVTVMKELTESMAPNIIGDANVVVDGLDNWKTRFILNDCCVRKRIPFVHAGVSEFYGQITTIMPRKGPCLRCIFPREPPEAGVIPVFGATPAALASLQVMEVIKLLTGIGKPLVGRMLFLDGEEMTVETAEIKRNPDCPVCGEP
jgi:molybdopterin/thiamine biosynthesis adenylyltransferase